MVARSPTRDRYAFVITAASLDGSNPVQYPTSERPLADVPQTWARVATFLAVLAAVCAFGAVVLITVVGRSPGPDLGAVPGEAETAASVAAVIERRISSAHDDLAEIARTVAPDDAVRVGALSRALDAHPEFLGATLYDDAGQMMATAGEPLPTDPTVATYTPVTLESDPHRVLIPMESAPDGDGTTLVVALDAASLFDGLDTEDGPLVDDLTPDVSRNVWIVDPDRAVIAGTGDTPRLVTLATRARREAAASGLAGRTSAQVAQNGEAEEIVAQAPISSPETGIELAVVTARSQVMSGPGRGRPLEAILYGAAALALAFASSIIRRSDRARVHGDV